MDATFDIQNENNDTDNQVREEFNSVRVQPWLPLDDDGTENTSGPLGWVNSATIEFDEDDDAVRLHISVGSPMGGFTLTVRRLPDNAPDNGGKLIMHVPTPGQPGLHAPLRDLHEGTYLIEGIG